ncbi:helix-turn-helix transcriptional regulator [Cryptosporangium aurantiacum]|uniref:Helix-turn-helix domain-containing protein n=1 Tax=Cryptosporangium aurantiacum TaxID=134849 RepID=A0A1M7QR33_9ACTN|nr:Helix-turn-helix domain-containing protein [Cryptosporangium aurantiacum]
MSENELGAFLRSRREALSPSAVGLPTGSRRRTPGLRRGELATLAGVSVEYLARLEQGRDRRPSAQVIAALADALRLSMADRIQLRRIAKAADNAPCLVIEPPTTVVRREVRMVLDRLEPTPAVVLNRLTDVLACTDGYTQLMRPFGLFDGARPNLTRYVLTDPRAREAYADWAAIADARVAGLQFGVNGADPHVAALAEELAGAAGDAFTTRACRASGMVAPTEIEVLRHPDVGELRLRFESLGLADSVADDQRLLVYLPEDEETSGRLDRLVRTGPRSVPGAGTAATGSIDSRPASSIGPRAAVSTRNRVASQRTSSP